MLFPDSIQLYLPKSKKFPRPRERVVVVDVVVPADVVVVVVFVVVVEHRELVQHLLSHSSSAHFCLALSTLDSNCSL